MKQSKQRVTIRNEATGKQVSLLLDRYTGRISKRQIRESFPQLATPGMTVNGEPVGYLGEFPLEQEPPEFPGQKYHVVRRGKPEAPKWGGSDLYFVPVTDDGEPSAALELKAKQQVPPSAHDHANAAAATA